MGAEDGIRGVRAACEARDAREAEGVGGYGCESRVGRERRLELRRLVGRVAAPRGDRHQEELELELEAVRRREPLPELVGALRDVERLLVCVEAERAPRPVEAVELLLGRRARRPEQRVHGARLGAHAARAVEEVGLLERLLPQGGGLARGREVAERHFVPRPQISRRAHDGARRHALAQLHAEVGRRVAGVVETRELLRHQLTHDDAAEAA
mmetsp:Transcript_413/g.1172  ORF Transcript_413/g.1172 Transcript_413/m.1172 type:complete len:212 (+) Transcript_413:98-733(+)